MTFAGIEYCPIHHCYTKGPCDLCIDDGIEDFSPRRAAQELKKLETELVEMADDLGCVEDIRTRTIEVIEKLKRITIR